MAWLCHAERERERVLPTCCHFSLCKGKSEQRWHGSATQRERALPTCCHFFSLQGQVGAEMAWLCHAEKEREYFPLVAIFSLCKGKSEQRWHGSATHRETVSLTCPVAHSLQSIASHANLATSDNRCLAHERRAHFNTLLHTCQPRLHSYIHVHEPREERTRLPI
eukprot:366140-Chlamydomonas_euryale.AAC.4